MTRMFRHDGLRPARPVPTTAAEPLTCIHAAYNFVALAEWVYFPPWSAEASHDLPFADGISGTLAFRCIAESPLLVADARPGNDKHFVCLPDGRRVIPGSTLRGMIRNVLEIAAFAKMSLVDNRQLGVRDLSGGLPVYNRTMTERVGRAFRARAETGWLRFENGRWRVYPCKHARVEHDDLAMLLGSDRRNAFKAFLQGRLDDAQRTAQAKYRLWLDLGGPLDIRFTPGPLRDHPHSRGNFLRYSKAGALGKGSTAGRLVLTGQPGPRKHMEFIFHSASPVPFEPDSQVMRSFLKIHEESRDWESWRRRHRRTGDDIPVFFLMADGKITSIGLTQMYKLPYHLSIHGALSNASPDHLYANRPDLVETLFGYAGHGADGDTGLKSRVSFGAACCDEGRAGEPATVILSAPKPTYYPNYIQQPTEPPGRRLLADAQGYSTLMDPDARLRGWKRYPAKSFKAPVGVPPGKVTSTLHPLAAGAVFSGKLRFHNLKPEELGALVWALTWNDDPHLVHSVGMGKPLGYGQVRFECGPADLQSNDPAMAGSTPEALLKSCMALFCAEMERAAQAAGVFSGWRGSPQIRVLLAMADPSLGADRELRHMVLDHHTRRNDFVEAKKRERALVLPEYEV